jgi:hypothetical protein
VHNGCVVPACSGSDFDPFALRGRADELVGTASRKLQRRDAAVQRLVMCQGYDTSRFHG